MSLITDTQQNADYMRKLVRTGLLDGAWVAECRANDRLNEIADSLEALGAEVGRLRAILSRYEAWEAKLVLDPDAWRNDLPRFTQELYDEWMEIQRERNVALAQSTESGVEAERDRLREACEVLVSAVCQLEVQVPGPPSQLRIDAMELARAALSQPTGEQ